MTKVENLMVMTHELFYYSPWTPHSPQLIKIEQMKR